MTNRSDYLSRFMAALRNGDAEAGIATTRGMAESGGVDLHSALGLVVLLARAEHPRFESAADRWLECLAEEGHPEEVREVAAAAIDGLRASYVPSRRCENALRALLAFHDDDLRSGSPIWRELVARLGDPLAERRLKAP